MVLSGALSLIMECAGIALMHVAGSLRRKASSGALPVEQQILELLHRVHGAPVGTVPAQSAPAQTVAPVAPAQTAPAPAPALPVASFKPAATVAPKDASTGLSYSSKTVLAGAGALAALTAAPMTHAAPAVPAADASAGAAKQSHLSAAKQSHSAEEEQAQTGASGAAEFAALSAAKQSHLSAAKPSHLDSASTDETAAPKRAWTATVVPDGTKLDTGTTGKAATRYNRIKAAVKAGKLKPSMRAIQAAEGGGGVVVRAYLQQLETEGVTMRAGRGWVLASKGGAA
jgi:hypothetical protein